MNGLEQRIHRTVTQELAARIHDTRVAMAEIASEADRRLNEERAHVDEEDRRLRTCCQERWDATAATTKRLGDRVAEFYGLTFWQRLRWLFRGY